MADPDSALVQGPLVLEFRASGPVSARVWWLVEGGLAMAL